LQGLNFVRFDAKELRRLLRTPAEHVPIATASHIAPQAPRPASRERRRWLLLFGLLSMGYLQYYFAEVFTTIALLPSPIYFISASDH